jgi:hypothetical protein
MYSGLETTGSVRPRWLSHVLALRFPTFDVSPTMSQSSRTWMLWAGELVKGNRWKNGVLYARTTGSQAGNR